MAEKKIDEEGRVWFCASYSVDDLRARPRRLVIDQQPVAVWMWKEKPFVTDANCYHAGGSLELATDIEEIAGQACIRCPLHKYIISIETGESFFQPVEFERCQETGKLTATPLPWKSKGIKQRTHLAKLEGNSVWISLQPRDTPVDSDKFASEAFARS